MMDRHLLHSSLEWTWRGGSQCVCWLPPRQRNAVYSMWGEEMFRKHWHHHTNIASNRHAPASASFWNKWMV